MISHRITEKICLEPGHPVRLIDAAGTRVRCLNGTVWITVANEAEDVFLGAGQSYLIARNGLSLVERIGKSSIQLEKLRAGGRLGGWLDELIRRFNSRPVR